MKLTKTNVPKCYGAYYKRSKWQIILDEFRDMNTECVKLSVESDDMYESTTSLYSSCWKAIKRYRVPVRVFKDGNDIYLIRTDMVEEIGERES